MEGGNGGNNAAEGAPGGGGGGGGGSSWKQSVSGLASKIFGRGGSSSEAKGKKVREKLVLNITDMDERRPDRPPHDDPIMAADELAPAPANAQHPAGQ